MERAALWSELMKLTPAERIDLAQDLWDSIAPAELPPLTDEERKNSTGAIPSIYAIRAQR